MPSPVLLRLGTRCPACGLPPTIRITAAERDAAMREPPDLEKQTYRCHNRKCGQVYSLVARDFQRAA